MYQLKQLPEDFVVKEISSVKPAQGQEGKYAYFLLRKKNLNTIAACQKVAKALGIIERGIGFAGNKDKQAVTEQVCSALNASQNKIESVKINCIELKFLGRGSKPVSLGDLDGNSFEIVVRNLSKNEKLEPKNKFINFFGEQRFSDTNAEVGKAIIKRDFKKACEILMKSEHNELVEHLEKSPSDFLGAIKTIPLKILKLLVNSYQSELWNSLAKETSKIEKENISLPLIGFGTEETETVKKILKKESLSARDFIIREFPELSSEGASRELYAEAKNLSIGNLENDELNEGMQKALIKFDLPKGCYATEFVKQLFD